MGKYVRIKTFNNKSRARKKYRKTPHVKAKNRKYKRLHKTRKKGMRRKGKRRRTLRGGFGFVKALEALPFGQTILNNGREVMDYPGNLGNRLKGKPLDKSNYPTEDQFGPQVKYVNTRQVNMAEAFRKGDTKAAQI